MLSLDDVIAVLHEHLKDNSTVQAIAKDLLTAEREAKESKTTGPRAKTRLVALLRTDGPSDIAGGAYIVSVPDEADAASNTYSGDALVQRLRKAAIEHNEAPRKRRGKASSKIETWSQFFTQVKAKTLKASGSQISLKQKGNPAEVVLLTTEAISAP